MQALNKKEKRTLLAALVATLASGVFSWLHFNAVALFILTGIALALLAAIVGQATEHLGTRMSAGATGVLQSALGNLPELFVGVFSLRAGLITVVQSALIGSVLANSLLVLGLAFFCGGMRHGTQRFQKEAPRLIATLSVLAVSALILPTLAANLHTPAGAHTGALSVASAVVLLIVFCASLPQFIQDGVCERDCDPLEEKSGWPLWVALTLLTLAGVGAAFVSDWFVDAMQPAMQTLHLSEAFTGLVIVAIAGNAVENVVGIQLAMRNKMDYAISVILNSSLQVYLALIPALVLLSFLISPHHLTLVMPPLLVTSLAVTTIISAMIVYDGESSWMEGVALIGLYGIIAACFWWG